MGVHNYLLEQILSHRIQPPRNESGLAEMVRISRGHRYRGHDIKVTIEGPTSVVTEQNLLGILESMASNLR